MGAWRPASVVVLALLAAAAGASGSDAPPAPLIGVNLAHYGNRGCDFARTGILASYGRPGVRDGVRRDLAAMRDAGIETLRLIVWHMRDPPDRRWGFVPSDGGRVSEPFRRNLIAYLEDVRDAGFEQLTLSFAPRLWNSPGRRFYD